ncbi:MAG: energy transducer TonB [Candidatus Acidiferrales bacterium]
MSGTINVKESHGKAITGAYLLKWVSPDQWREEIRFANYTRIRVGGKDQYWQSRTTDYEIEPVLELDQALGFLKEFHVRSNASGLPAMKSIKFHEAEKHGHKLDCVTLVPSEDYYSTSGDYCFDAAGGWFVSQTRDSLQLSNFIPFGGEYFPGSVHTNQESAARVDLQLNSITPLGKMDGADFRPPANASAWPACDDPDALPKLKSEIPPHYPDNEKYEHVSGTVFIYATMGIDGQLHNLKVLSAPDTGLANAALTAVEQWQYTPEMCHGAPVPVETLIHIIFDLGS